MKLVKALCAQIILLSVALVGAVVSMTFGLYEKSADSKGTYGQIALRSYFHSGSGLSDDPYVITRPEHMYNLSRLQSLGIFKNKVYFQLGTTELDPDGEQPMCFGPDNVTPVPFLDMSQSGYDRFPINAIGSEAVPFNGEFDGQNLEIKNLTVFADPEDAGLFGYTSHGSNIHNLFLDGITINALGYTDGYADLYGPDCTLSNGVSFSYSHSDSTPSSLVFDVDTDAKPFAFIDISDYLESEDPDAVPANAPRAVASLPSSEVYTYSLLQSGNFLKVNASTNTVDVDMAEVCRLFKEKVDDSSSKFPIIASSTVSVIASRLDGNGLEHTKVIMTLEYYFTMSARASKTVYLEVGNSKEKHGNNIGLIIGHCDGSASDCYVHNGKFNMNNNAGGTITGSYNPVENASNFGLIGLVGNSVHDVAAEESDSTTKAGKDIGVLDFTTVYDDIVDSDTTFPDPEEPLDGGKLGIKYYPNENTKYKSYLRYDSLSSDYYVTKESDYVSFRGKQVIWNNELGIFTIATDASSTGVEGSASDHFGETNTPSTIHKENDVTYLYYATGEYSSKSGVSFAHYRDSLESSTPQEFLLGNHLPNTDELSAEGFEQREMHQNYFFRFELQPNYRRDTDNRLYFADVDDETPGGSFISKYFNYKLVDQNSQAIPVGDPKSGVMVRNGLNEEIGSFSASFVTKDLSYPSGTEENRKPRLYCLDDEEYNYPAANSINFEIKTDVANVTVVAAPNEAGKAAGVGVYRTEVNGDYPTLGGNKYIPKNFEDPEYAFFMPRDDHLAYFDYTVDQSARVGKVGVYTSDSKNSFEEADYTTNATVPNEGGEGVGEKMKISGQPRLFVHTFKLEKGRYCLGAATGANSDALPAGAQTIPKIYYICAQGQVDGQLQFDNNAFASNDTVQTIDFIKTERFTYNPLTKEYETNITFGDDAAYSSDSTLLQHQRCYLAFKKSDRSKFEAGSVDLSLAYIDDKFKITSTDATNIARIVITNYGQTMNLGDLTGITNTTVSLLGLDDSDKNIIVYAGG